MYRGLFRLVKSRIPRISDTELVALRSGSTSLDRDILKGTIDYPKEFKSGVKAPLEKLNYLLQNFDGDQIYPINKTRIDWVSWLAKNRFFSFIIDEKYGGIKLSTNELSNVITKISSKDPALGVIAMVPNSLGPGELLTHYGTEKQKESYLPGLADGTYIPCFGLTGPNNGSDATGSIDQGTIVEKDGKLMIKVNLNKRYITLAPVSNLLGIAFNLKDPDNLLGKEGITVALVESSYPGIKTETHHNPLNVGFPNGTIKGEIYIDLDRVIGGEKNIGMGWKMLMECLSAGRGVSLPAASNASSKSATYGIYNYIKLRKQFKLPLAEMEAIQYKFNKMVFDTWIIQSSIKLTNDILDSGLKPSVISAIMKQQCTERGRDVINHAMDIHGGGAICLGYSNFLEKYYRGVPIGITVEGSNTITRSLIIFGQGLNKSHPYIFPVLDSILKDDLTEFKKSINGLVGHCIKMYFKSLVYQSDKLESQVVDFANLTNFVAIKGGSLKREQILSGDMADIFSNLYLAISVRYYQKLFIPSFALTEWIVDTLIQENQKIINRVIGNLGSERYLLQHLKKEPKTMDYDKEREIFKEIMENPRIINEIQKNISLENNVLSDLEKVNKLSETTEEYEVLKNRIINVGEFKN